MPRVSGIYSRPTGIDAVANNTIDSGKYNSQRRRRGGRPQPAAADHCRRHEGTNPRDARIALGAEAASQIVDNYDTFLFWPGSFVSAVGTTSEPFPGFAAGGFVYGTGSNQILEARQLSAGPIASQSRMRAFNGSVWGPWTDESPTKSPRPAIP